MPKRKSQQAQSKGPWTEEEDAKLRRVVNAGCGVHNDIGVDKAGKVQGVPLEKLV